MVCSNGSEKMDKEIWGIAGIIIGFLGKGLIDLINSRRTQEHAEKMYKIKNQGAENIKELLLEMLNHRKYIDRTFDALKKRIGGYSDEEIRKFLMDVGAQKVRNNKNDVEMWYLTNRQEERIARKNPN